MAETGGHPRERVGDDGAPLIWSLARRLGKLLQRDRLAQVTVALFLASGLPLFIPILGEKGLRFFVDYTLDPAFILMILVAVVPNLRRQRTLEHRLFWLLVLVAFSVLLVLRLSYLVVSREDHSQFQSFLIDVGYVVFYLTLLVAIEIGPPVDRGWLRKGRSFAVEIVGVVLGVLALTTYFLIIPGRFNNPPDAPHAPAFELFVFLDVLLLVALLKDLRWMERGVWKDVYLLVLGVCGLTLFLDLFEIGVTRGILSPASSLHGYSHLWLTTLVMVVLAARVALVAPAHTRPQDFPGLDERMGFEGGGILGSTLVAYGFLLPIAHFGLYALGFLDDASRGPRELMLFCFLVLFGVLALAKIRWMEATRRLAQSGYKDLFEFTPVMIVVAAGRGEPGRIIDCNRLFVDTLGRSKRWVRGIRLDSILLGSRPDDLTDDEPPIGPREEQLVVGDDLVLPVLVQRRRIRLQRESGWLVTLVDLSEMRELEERLRQSQKLEAVGRLAGGLAHDFNNLLTVIKGYSVLLHDCLSGQVELQGQAEEIRLAAERAAHLTQQLLAFGRRQVLRPSRVGLHEELEKLRRVLRKLLRPEIELHYGLDANLDEVLIDVGQIQQVILDLVSNAQESIQAAGRISISTFNPGWAEVRNAGLSTKSHYVALEVSDTGEGIEESVREQIFEPFFTTKGLGRASGLGLPSILGVVEQSGGTVRVASQISRGSTFTIFLPLASLEDPGLVESAQLLANRR